MAFAAVSPLNLLTVPTHFNLTFKLNAEPSVTMSDAVVIVQKALDAAGTSGSKADLARRWLFPEEADLEQKDEESRKTGRSIDWVDGNLNEEQKVNATAPNGPCFATDLFPSTA